MAWFFHALNFGIIFSALKDTRRIPLPNDACRYVRLKGDITQAIDTDHTARIRSNLQLNNGHEDTSNVT